MADTKLSSAELRAFFENVALMLSVGVQTDEAVHLLLESTDDGALRRCAQRVYTALIEGDALSAAMQQTGSFPAYAVSLVAAGEGTGRTESVLRQLAGYYDEEERLFAKVRASIGYPCVLLCVLSAILAFTVAAILPVFLGVYESMAGGLAASSYGMVGAGMVIGWVALGLTLVLTVLALVAFASSRTPTGRERLMRTLGKMPFARAAFSRLALSRFTSALAVYTAAGMNVDDAVGEALRTVEDAALRAKVAAAYGSMTESVRASSLPQAFAAAGVFDAQHIRTLTFGLRTGRVDDVLTELADGFFDEAIDGFDAMVDRVEPALAGFTTVAVGATLIAVMLPLIGIMGTIG